MATTRRQMQKEDAINLHLPHKTPRRKQWQLIGGYGKIGDTNWGFDENQIQTDRWLAECQRHVGETVLLTGGGSFGNCWLAKLTRVFLRDWGRDGQKRVAVRLENIKPKWSTLRGNNFFEPWLGSWQISVKE